MKMNKTRFFLFPYIAIKHNEYVYGRQLYTVTGDLSIQEVEHYIEVEEECDNVIITGIFEMSEDDYLAKHLLQEFINNVVADLFADMLLQPKGRGHINSEEIKDIINQLKM